MIQSVVGLRVRRGRGRTDRSKAVVSGLRRRIVQRDTDRRESSYQVLGYTCEDCLRINRTRSSKKRSSIVHTAHEHSRSHVNAFVHIAHLYIYIRVLYGITMRFMDDESSRGHQRYQRFVSSLRFKLLCQNSK